MNKIELVTQIVDFAKSALPGVYVLHEMPEAIDRPFVKVTYLGLEQAERDTSGDRIKSHTIAIAVGASPTEAEGGDQLAERYLSVLESAVLEQLESLPNVLTADFEGGDLTEFEERLPQSGSVTWLAGIIINVMIQ